jgi:hypothetical protein
MNNKDIKQYNNKYNNEYKNNTYIDLTCDANYIVVSSKSTFCYKCGKELDENSLDTFCDYECRREYYAEIKKDYDGIYFGGW